ncbi:hypothetical protein PT015_21600 [Candidatus Mycobacterium wuenschmannii]|uniref:MAE-28990/MAE-18760-like HEPN domain-containing protein n=1 Tax=Candidatus Mycobacterium wuenschmannii TaxID=3027808 RepID=A0ABY8VUT4_9MYCO|nr:hypothetical protein [Candidatus Mycobacterium wuenschmannii]WIM87405.1 hypothetical protein PT015_21600 [Candidatus Mycobacterium wuenschmannii]
MSEGTWRADEASGLLFRTIAAHRATVVSLGTYSRQRRLSGPLEDREQIQCQATLVRLLSIAESFSGERLLEELQRIVDRSSHKAINEIWERTAVSATNTWDEQKKAYKELLGVTLSNADWTSVGKLAEARNAVAHGLGALTRRQLRNRQGTVDKLRSCGITLVNGRIVLSDQVLFDAARTCREFIRKLDFAIENRGPDYR